MKKNEKRRILYLITKSELGGAQSHVLDLIRGFCDQYEIHLAVGADGPLVRQSERLGAKVHILPNLIRSINPLSDLMAVRQCVSLIRRVRPDLVHAHSSKAGVVGRLAGRIAKVPTIFTAHGWGFSPGIPRTRQMVALVVEKSMAPLARKIICVSEFDHQLSKRYGVGTTDSLRVVRNGISPVCDASDKMRETATLRKQPPRIIMVARFSNQKDHTTLLHALTRIEDDFHLDLVGSGPGLEATKKLATSLNLSARVSFLGDRHDIPSLLQEAQCFVLSTHYEGLPISILEAMRAGLPVVSTNVGGISEEVENNTTGCLVAPRDVEALSESLRRLIRNPELRETLGRAGRAKFIREFTLPQMIKSVDMIYQEALRP